MPKTKDQKKEILQTLEDKLSRSKSIVFSGFNALEVKDNEELRQKLQDNNAEYLVAKKTLLSLALKNSLKLEIDPKQFEGKLATVFSYEDEVAGAKTLADFAKGKEDKVYLLGGILEGKLMSQEQVIALAKLPSKEELYAKVVGSLNAPISGFVNVLAGSLRSLFYTLKAIEEQKSN
jgi:large subunit ribosomal protein L10